ncbi:hypothetical protein KTT_51400 [Tengunoibacter tsumagoiensis]|uniref:histidine kinase n=2 Tax=Tengunoibacter tsumagoiensis TaxID=2014871 RepID=A0A402A8J4_9CHLR|nr:hypothetical protein KTT_51400 [Tengunoibacter tsumagoiensis]
MQQATMGASASENAIYTIVLAGAFGGSGTVLLFRLRNVALARMVYVIFLSAGLMSCFLLMGSWHRALIVSWAILAQGMVATVISLASVFPHRSQHYLARHVALASSPLMILAAILAICHILAGLFFPFIGTSISFLVYLFSLFCMCLLIWGIHSGFQRLAAEDRVFASMTIIGLIFALMSFAMNSNAVLYHVPMVPTSVGFLLLFSLLVACVALVMSFLLWELRHWKSKMMPRVLNILCLLCPGIGMGILLVLLRFTPEGDFLQHAVVSFVTYHLLLLPVMLLPLVCYTVLLTHQLAGQTGLLSRSLVRSMLWFSLASCFVLSHLFLWGLLNSLVSFDRSLVQAGWFMLSLCLFPWCWQKVRMLGDQVFYRDFYAYNRTLRDYSFALTRSQNFWEICEVTLPLLARLLNASEVEVIVKKELVLPSDYPPFHATPLSRWVSSSSLTAEKDERGAKREQEYMQLVAAAEAALSQRRDKLFVAGKMLLFPLYEGERRQGYLCVGPKLNKEGYSTQDISFLETVTAQLTLLEICTRATEQVRLNARQLAALNHRLLQAQEDERRHLALELHDGTLQQAMLLARHLADHRDYPQALEGLSLARTVVQSLRSTCLELRPPLLSELGLREAIGWLAQQAQQRGKLTVSVTYRGDETLRLPQKIELTMYRIIQETLNNILKHSQAQAAWIRMRMSQDGTCSLLIIDNGRGMQAQQVSAEHLGLVGMAERIQAIHGLFQLRSSPGKGVCVRVICRPGHHPSHKALNWELAEPI